MGNKKIILRFRWINRDIFLEIKKGRKKIETRAASTMNRSIKIGDKLVLVCGKEKIERNAKRVKIFKTIPALLKKYKPQQIHPGARSEKEITKIYYSFPEYREKIKKYGLIAIELE